MVIVMDLPPPTWLRTFEAAARLGSFRAAAEELGLTPAAVSQQMRLLEQHVKTLLFERLPRGVALTDTGKAYAQAVRKGLADIQAATQGLFGRAKRARIRVRASISCAALVIAPRLHEFLEAHPNIDVELSTFVWADNFQLGDSDVDIRFGFGDWTDGRVTHLGHEFAIPVCSPHYLASFSGKPDLRELASEHMISIQGSESDWPLLFKQRGQTPPVNARITRFDSSLMALQTLCNSRGLAVVLESFAESFLNLGLLIAPFDEKIAIRPAHFLIERNDAQSRKEVEAFREWVKSIYRVSNS